MRGKLIIGVMAFLCVSCGRAVSILDSDFSLDHIIEVEGRQGVATDGNFYYISGSTALYKYDMKGNLVAKTRIRSRISNWSATTSETSMNMTVRSTPDASFSLMG